MNNHLATDCYPDKPRLICLDETDSTNRYLQTLSQTESLANETVVVAGFQTTGKGQPGHFWESEANKNLTYSILYYPTRLPANQPFVISELAALSVKQTLDNYATDITVKWPNDIYWKDLKICGILIENELTEGWLNRSIIGIGLNLNQRIFQGDAPNPVSLIQITGVACDRMAILDRLRDAFHRLHIRLETEGMTAIHREYVSALYRRDGFHLFRDAEGIFKAKIAQVDLSGHLKLERSDGRFSHYAFKEVAFIP
ncbi:MAG: biotin--[acetyl-CoA-carboxylase] ligase [Tannerella sp.]|jgi:BirA family biotin operon repressor/biotin-[acetyl-CoA-carboxylase] ligase|nr:biotin--[acetyl-CoA-carboxylase] ligase [Tannerella sp.]